VPEHGVFRIRAGIADELLECGPARQAMLAGDGELRLVQRGEFTGRQPASCLQLQEAEARPAGKRT
jgi:hypothetical protein